jgi:hypothetical protein
MPIASPWYAYDSAGSAIYVDGTSNQIENAYDLVVAINGGTTATNVVSNFGYWNSAGQSISGVMISDLATARTELEAINILPGVGYQVYVSSSKSLVISNQMP